MRVRTRRLRNSIWLRERIDANIPPFINYPFTLAHWEIVQR
jgi:hypothetical protein